MKRRGPMWALVGVVTAGLVALSGSPSLAQEDIYENVTGLMGGTMVPGNAGLELAGFTAAGPRLNPNGVGQFLMGAYYDVRPVGADPQINNIQIINTNTNNVDLPPCTMGAAVPTSDYYKGIDGEGCYNANGGILAKVRFRESKTSQEVLDFVIALSCGEVWAGKIDLNDATGLPEIESRYPIVTQPFTAVGFPTRPAFDPNAGGAVQSFLPTGGLTGISNLDVQRGHIEVIAMERLPCEPISGDFTLAGGNWARLDPQVDDTTPTNAIGAEIFLVRPLAAISHNYNFAALSNFVGQGLGRITPNSPFSDSQPDFSACSGSDGAGAPYAGNDCVSQTNLALSKARIMAKYDVDPATAGTTDVVITFPSKYKNCNAVNGVWNGQTFAATPFGCAPGGEEVVCTIYDRQENYFEEEEGFISPGDQDDPCTLPREVNIIALSEGGGVGLRGDIGFATGNLPAGESGWVDIDLVRNFSSAVIHREVFPDAITQDILGAYVRGYHGLPTLSLVLQEFQNIGEGRFYGNTVPPLFDCPVIIKDGQS